MEIEVNGVVYESKLGTSKESCAGCSARKDWETCKVIMVKKECASNPFIWLKKEIKQPTSDLNQNPNPSTKEEKETLVEPSKGVKNDSGKIEWSYLPIEPMNEVLKVLMLGDKKYPSPDGCNWKVVPNAKKRYYNAALRHLTSWYNGEKTDQETGYNHLAHAVTNCLFLLWFEIKGYPKD